MATIPNNVNTTAYLIEEKHIKSSIKNRRGYLGMSSLGSICKRQIWYSFHYAQTHYKYIKKKKKFKFQSKNVMTARLSRLFERGDWEESRIINDLKSIGIKVWGEQMEINDDSKHIRGHIDGLALGVVEAPKTIHLLEFKTANERNFNQMVKNGIQKSHPKYYGQIQLYMHFLMHQHKIKANRCLFIATNKNNESRLYHRLEYDQKYALDLIEKGTDIINMEKPPLIKFRRTSLTCKWCDFNIGCHEGAKFGINCRTCKHAHIIENGEWLCTKHDRKFTEPVPCKKYKAIKNTNF